MKKIGFVSTMEGEAWGGSEELWCQAATRIAAKGTPVSACVLRWPQVPEPLRALEQAGAQVTFRRNSLAGRVMRKLLRRVSMPWIDKTRPDFVVLSQGCQIGGIEWMEAFIARGMPFAVIIQAAGEVWWPGDDNLVDRYRRAYESAEACYFVSHGNLELVRRQLATDLMKGQVVRNPFKVSYDAEPPWPAETGEVALACIGRLEPQAKGQDILFDVFAQDKWRERPIRVDLFGSGNHAKTLERLAAMRGLTNIRFAGFVTDIEKVWSEHQALILPSRHEGLPLVVVESMLCGRPCIVTDVAGNAEFIRDGENGFVAAAPTARFLDEALERAWAVRSDWRRIGDAASHDVRAAIPRDPISVFIDLLLPHLS